MIVPARSALRGYALILTAACLWATIGLFYRALVDGYGLSPQVVVAYRAGLAALAIAVGLAATRPAALRIRRADLRFFMLFGVFGVAVFVISYIQALTTGSVAQAAVLLYTAPIWIAVWAVVHEGERLEGPRLLALALAVAGCALVAQAYDPARLKINALAVGYGLLSGLTYAAYSLWSAEGTRRGYDAWTVVLYSFGFGAVVVFAITPIRDTVRAATTAGAWPLLLGVSLVTGVVAPVCFTFGLRHVRTSNASILATLEPVVAALLAWMVLGEALAPPQIVGGACVLLAVVVLVRASSRREVRRARPAALPSES